MFYYYFDSDGYGPDYIEFRGRIDSLCRKITGSQLTFEEAHSEYSKIEEDYALLEDSRVELFKMIYESRIIRLCDQFSLERA
jgi:hypothetical protein